MKNPAGLEVRSSVRWSERFSLACRAALVSLLFLCLPGGAVWFDSPAAHAETSPVPEHQVKAAMAFNIAKYADWPEGVFPAGGSPFTVCVLGDGPFGQAMYELEGKTIKGRSVTVTPVTRSSGLAQCRMLVVNRYERERLSPFLASAARNHVLTIGDTPQFAEQGGIVGLVTREEKVRFEINLSAADDAKIRLSSTLLRLATIVGEKAQ